jgi:hypothetical protein
VLQVDVCANDAVRHDAGGAVVVVVIVGVVVGAPVTDLRNSDPAASVLVASTLWPPVKSRCSLCAQSVIGVPPASRWWKTAPSQPNW